MENKKYPLFTFFKSHLSSHCINVHLTVGEGLFKEILVLVCFKFQKFFFAVAASMLHDECVTELS
jgi:hypothetical protein